MLFAHTRYVLHGWPAFPAYLLPSCSIQEPTDIRCLCSVYSYRLSPTIQSLIHSPPCSTCYTFVCTTYFWPATVPIRGCCAHNARCDGRNMMIERRRADGWRRDNGVVAVNDVEPPPTYQ